MAGEISSVALRIASEEETSILRSSSSIIGESILGPANESILESLGRIDEESILAAAAAANNESSSIFLRPEILEEVGGGGSSNMVLPREVTGFETEEELRDFIATTTDPKSPRLQTMFSKMKSWAANHPGTIITTLVASGSAAAFLSNLKTYQRMNTGCFVYYKDKLGNDQRRKIPNRSCEDSYVESTFDIDKLPHPLDGISWNCDYDISDLIKHDNYDILRKGCKAICNPQNYNALAYFASPRGKYKKVDIDSSTLRTYSCERGTFLSALGHVTGEMASEVGGGLVSELLKNINFNVIYRLIIIIVVCILAYKLVVRRYGGR